MMNTAISAQTQKAATELPDISVIGNFKGVSTDTAKTFDVSEIEFSFQHYLYPSVKANIFAALHKGASGQHSFELEEAYVTFSDLVDVLFPNTDTQFGLGATVGKKLLNVGKVNALHPEQWAFVDRPLVVKQFFGADEGLGGEGGSLSYLLPTPFFSQVELGYWTAAKHEEVAGAEHENIEYSNRILNARLWNSFSLSDAQEFELGFSYLQGNASAKTDDAKQDVMGIDATFTQELAGVSNLKLQAEYLTAKYGEDGGERESQNGMYLTALYKLDKFYQAGVRFGNLSKHGDDADSKEKNQLSLMLTRQLTETSKFRVQYNTGDNIDKSIIGQFIFGMGPHSHVLQ